MRRRARTCTCSPPTPAWQARGRSAKSALSACRKPQLQFSDSSTSSPSTGVQQMNDHRYVIQSDARLGTLFSTCRYKLKITDGGSDQNPRNEEVKFALTFDHLVSKRIIDIYGTRCAGLSPLNEAENVNGAETSALTRAEAPSMLAAGVPKSPEEIRRNARQFGQAITNSIRSGGRYGGKPFVSLYSHPDLPPEELKKSETISPAMRIAARAPSSTNGRAAPVEQSSDEQDGDGRHGGPGDGLRGDAHAVRSLQQPAQPLCVPQETRSALLPPRLPAVPPKHAIPAL